MVYINMLFLVFFRFLILSFLIFVLVLLFFFFCFLFVLIFVRPFNCFLCLSDFATVDLYISRSLRLYVLMSVDICASWSSIFILFIFNFFADYCVLLYMRSKDRASFGLSIFVLVSLLVCGIWYFLFVCSCVCP